MLYYCLVGLCSKWHDMDYSIKRKVKNNLMIGKHSDEILHYCDFNRTNDVFIVTKYLVMNLISIVDHFKDLVK